ncbi:MAG: hypothetical protein O3A82_01715 [Verrucomicrobia bacterium]|jgi:hypothetical protein|nr:hypothetical protein [Verrucomicrobiota bacterium]MDA1045626.1 hypothetical protein [Verrucomicrobiota bacterium]
MKLMLRLTFCVLSLFFFSCIEEGSSEDKSVPEVNPKGKKFLVKAKQYSREDFLAHKSADKAAKGNASGGSSTVSTGTNMPTNPPE